MLKYLMMLLFLLVPKIHSAQLLNAIEEESYFVTYEVIPKEVSRCAEFSTTIIFTIPVTKDYYDSITINQEITSWFKTINGFVVNSYMSDRWRLVIKEKKNNYLQ